MKDDDVRESNSHCAHGSRWLRARLRGPHATNVCTLSNQGGEMRSFIGSKMGRNNALTFGSALLP